MKNNSLFRYIYIGLGAIIMVLCIVLLMQNKGCDEEDPPVLYPSEEQTTEAQVEATEAPYESPIDWEEQWSQNPEIYAWMYIPGTEISYPVVQREGDDTYYLTHSAYLKEYSAGALMSESAYNDKSFDEPVTIVYGHKMRSGAMLGTLQQNFSTEEGFESHREIIIYLPDRELHYKVWVATPFDNYHIMQTYDFTSSRQMRLFIKTIMQTRSIEGQIDPDMNVTAEDKLLIISTCLKGKVSMRYLVIGRLETVIER